MRSLCGRGRGDLGWKWVWQRGEFENGGREGGKIMYLVQEDEFDQNEMEVSTEHGFFQVDTFYVFDCC